MVCAIRSIPRWRSGCDVSNTVLEVSNLSVAIKGGDRTHAVQGINLTVGADEIVCVVGESGSGKSVTAQAVMGLLPKGAMRVESGWIRLQGDQLLTKSDAELRAIRGTRMAMVFQEPILKLVREMQGRTKTGVLFITHDFGVVSEIADRVVVMQMGRIVEQGPCEEVLRNPREDYTRMLLGAVPSMTPPKRSPVTGPVVLQTEN